MNNKSDFAGLRQDPIYFRGFALEVFYKPSVRSVSRLGITIKGRLSSVQRNKLKRTLREFFRCNFNQTPNIDCNFVFKIAKGLQFDFWIESVIKDLNRFLVFYKKVNR